MLTMSLAAQPAIMMKMGRFTKPLAWSTELHTSMTHTKMEAMPRIIMEGSAMV